MDTDKVIERAIELQKSIDGMEKMFAAFCHNTSLMLKPILEEKEREEAVDALVGTDGKKSQKEEEIARRRAKRGPEFQGTRISACAEFQAKMEELRKKFPLLETLYAQGAAYETMTDCPIRQQIDQELGIVGWELSPIYANTSEEAE
jgi:phage I-like protein